MSNDSHVTLQNENLKLLLDRCIREKGFRETLLTNPRAVFEDNGVFFPPSVTIRAIPMVANEFLLVVPPYEGPDFPRV